VIPELRKRFNENWTPELYTELLHRLDRVTNTPVGYRCSETPLFLPTALVQRMVRYGQELYAQLAVNDQYKTASQAAIPAQFRVPNETEHPLFVQADFGFVHEANGQLAPKLVEIQGFPSIYAFQVAMAKVYQEVYRLDKNVTPFLCGLDESSYFNLLRKAILNGHAPEETVLLEIDPYTQKTLPDFLETQRVLGIKIAGITEVQRRGNKLFFHGIPVKRIYNRVIADELMRKKVQTDFAFSDDLDVEWAGHPNWFFRLSKFSTPWFNHECVPETWFLDEIPELPEDLSNYVLKPLYSFAGLGVVIGPSKEEIAAIPQEHRHDFILQRKMDFVPTLATPSGMTKVEVRIMYVWDDGLKPVTTIIRTGRGKMMGVDFNKNLDWVGASAGFVLEDDLDRNSEA
jgi:hypothetical protein